MTEFLFAQSDYVYFGSGLALVLLAFGCFELVRAGQSLLPWSYLGYFALLQGLNAWLRLLLHAFGGQQTMVILCLIFTTASLGLLLEFARAGWQQLGHRGSSALACLGVAWVSNFRGPKGGGRPALVHALCSGVTGGVRGRRWCFGRQAHNRVGGLSPGRQCGPGGLRPDLWVWPPATPQLPVPPVEPGYLDGNHRSPCPDNSGYMRMAAIHPPVAVGTSVYPGGDGQIQSAGAPPPDLGHGPHHGDIAGFRLDVNPIPRQPGEAGNVDHQPALPAAVSILLEQ